MIGLWVHQYGPYQLLFDIICYFDGFCRLYSHGEGVGGWSIANPSCMWSGSGFRAESKCTGPGCTLSPPLVESSVKGALVILLMVEFSWATIQFVSAIQEQDLPHAPNVKRPNLAAASEVWQAYKGQRSSQTTDWDSDDSQRSVSLSQPLVMTALVISSDAHNQFFLSNPTFFISSSTGNSGFTVLEQWWFYTTIII